MTQSIDEYPLVIAYRRQLMEANELLQHLTQMIQNEINEYIEEEHNASKTKNTPMMEQYLSIKAQYQDAFCSIVSRFYELFYEDAVKAAQILELTLTSRNRNADDPIPMCGVPHHSAQGYIDSLIEKRIQSSDL